MCGIVFTMSKPHHHPNLSGFMNDGLIAGQVRGMDSTGVFRVSHLLSGKTLPERSITSNKKAFDAVTFMRSQVNKDLVKSTDWASLTVGHTRHKTQGSVRDANAHPFEIMREDQSTIIGVHNGTLNGWKDMEEGDEYDVDSEWLYNMIAEDGIEAFRGFDGAYALVWYDTNEPNIVNIARNDKRTLFFARTADRKGVVGASELGMLAWLASRNNIQLWEQPNDKAGEPPHKIFYFAPGNLYKFDLTTMDIVSTTKLPTFDAANNPYKLTKPRATVSPIMSQINNRSSAVATGRPFHKFDQTHVFQTVQKIMADMRGERSGDKKEGPQPEVVTSDDLVDGSDVAAQASGHLALHGVEVGKRLLFAEGMSASSATGKEIALAKSLGYFGLVGYARSYYHEEETSELRCCFSLVSPKPGEVIAFDDDAVIKFVKASMHEIGGVYSDKAMANTKFAVVGVQENKSLEPKKPDYPTLVLVPVSDGVARFVNRRVTPIIPVENAGGMVH